MVLYLTVGTIRSFRWKWRTCCWFPRQEVSEGAACFVLYANSRVHVALHPWLLDPSNILLCESSLVNISSLQNLCPVWLLWASLCSGAWKSNSTLHWSPRCREHFWHLYMFSVTILILIVLLYLDVYFNSNLTHLIEMIKTCKKHTEICCITGTLHLFPLNRLGWRKGRVFLFTRLQTFLTFNHINSKERVIYVTQPILWKSYLCCKKKILMLHSLGFLGFWIF